MYTLLIVEDNDFERNALQRYIDWDVLDLKVVDTAFNGQDGFEKAMKHQPDIIISDVKMPIMDGIEMAKAITRANPQIKFVFSSGHDDVALLKEALELRAYSYLTKPVKQEELVSVLKKLTTVFMEERLSQMANRKMTEQLQSHLPGLQAQFLEQLMIGKFDKDKTDFIYHQVNDLKLRMTGLYKLALIEMDFPSDSDVFRVTGSIHGILGEMQQDCPPEAAIFVKDGNSRIAAILHSLREDTVKEVALMSSIERRIAELAKAHSFRYAIGVSNRASDLTGLNILYRQCCIALQRKVELGYGTLIPYEEQYERSGEFSDRDTNRIKRMIDNIVTSVCEGQDGEEDVRKLALAIAEDQGLAIHRIQSVIISLFSRLSRHANSIGENLESIVNDDIELYHGIVKSQTVPDMMNYVCHALRKVSSYMNRKKLGKDDYIVQEILSILNSEYHLPITLSYLSDKVYLSPNYLRILFKGKMNVSIQEYLTQLRINKAKELLRHNRLKVHEVGESVGYENSTYFSMVFKSYVQMTPGEYRSKHLVSKDDA